MLILKAKFLEARQLPGSDPYPPSTLVSVLAGADTLHLIGPEGLLGQLASTEAFADVVFELRWRRLDLATLGGGRGKAYRLSVVRLLDPAEVGP